MLLYIIRHGDPIYGPVERLTETGLKQARALAPRMAQSGITRIFSSPLRRARETAAPTAELLGLPIEIEPWCSENVAWQRFTRIRENGHRTWTWNREDAGALVRGESHDAGDAWADLPVFSDTPGAKEGYAALQKESDAFLARLGYVREGNEYRIENPNDGRPAVFCHQGFGLSWLSHLLRIPPNIFWTSFDVTHTGVSVLEFRNTKTGYTVPKCLCLSDMSHLFADSACAYAYNTRTPI